MKHKIVISDNLGSSWFALPPVLTSMGINSWVAFSKWCRDREVDVFIKFLPASYDDYLL